MATIAIIVFTESIHLSRRKMKVDYWQEAPMARDPLVIIPTALEASIPDDHPLRLVDETLNQLASAKQLLSNL